ncbi:MAG: hypothetical protein BGO26_06670 [Actinobacteria bacterium 69-20]|nr:MAG: hypothetical protein BGO26_06670 [Actinobacteria bacterium 69-20]
MKRTSRRLVIAACATPTVAAVLVVALVMTAFAALASTSGGIDSDGGGVVDPAIRSAACSPTGVAAPGLTPDQAANAAVIVAVAGDRGLGVRAAVVGVMTALTESSLLNIDYGDHGGPDSRGLFQQRDSWGPVAVRMDPAGAAGLFFDRLETIDGWQQLPPWIAAQQVQHSAFADGSNYAAHYNAAVAAVRRMAGGADGATPNAGDPTDASTSADPDIAGNGTGTSAADPGAVGDPGFDMAAFCGSGIGGVTAGGWGGYSNGLIPATALCPLSAAGQLLRCDAATEWDAMSAAYQAVAGSPICITDSYRSLAVQVRLRAEKPTLAAVPGTSNHGWALAVDMCEAGRTAMGFTTPTYLWLKANAAAFGWAHPAWAEPGQGQEEPWHWEYVGGTP